MTKEEAIEMLKRCGAEPYCYNYNHGKHCEGCNQRIAQDMAIKALGELKTESEEDLINNITKSIYWNTDFSNLGAKILLGDLKKLIKYWIKINGTLAAENMTIETALVLIEGMYRTYYNDVDMIITIGRMDENDKIN